MPGSGIPSLLSSGGSPANTLLDSGTISLMGTVDAVLLVLTSSAASALGWTVTLSFADGSSYSVAGDFAGVHQWTFLFGDIDGAPVALVNAAGGIPAVGGPAMLRFPGGKAARRPVSVRIQIQALGAGIFSGYAISAERS